MRTPWALVIFACRLVYQYQPAFTRLCALTPHVTHYKQSHFISANLYTETEGVNYNTQKCMRVVQPSQSKYSAKHPSEPENGYLFVSSLSLSR